MTRVGAVGAAGAEGAGRTVGSGRQEGQGWEPDRGSVYVCLLSPFLVCGVGGDYFYVEFL